MSMTLFEEHFFTSSDGTVLCYESSPGEQKHKTPLVFLHGLGGTLQAWENVRTFLQAQGYQSYALDLRGQGKSGRPTTADAYTWERMALDISEFCQHVGASRVILVGHCFGGLVAQAFAALYPKNVQQLVLVSTGYQLPWYIPAWIRGHLFSQFVAKCAQLLPFSLGKQRVNYARFFGTDDIHVQRIWSDIRCTSAKSYLFLVHQLLPVNHYQKLKSITAQTIVIVGQRDCIYPVSSAQDLVTALPQARLVVLPKANHILVINNPRELATAIQTYLEQTDQATIQI